MSIKEQVARDINALSESDLRHVAEYLAFLKFRAKNHNASAHDEAQLAALYAEFGDEDRSLAEEGLADYAADLGREDAR